MQRTAIALALILLTAAPVLAASPLATDDAGTVDPGRVEVEFNGSYVHDRQKSVGGSTSSSSTDLEAVVTAGLCRNLDISLAIPYTVTARERVNGTTTSMDGFGDMSLEVKYTLGEAVGIGFAVKPLVILPTGRYGAGLSEGRWQFGGTLIASRLFEEGKYALHADLGYEYHHYRTGDVRAATRSNHWSGSVAGEAEVARGLFAVAEVGLSSNPEKGQTELPVYGLTGGRYELTPFLDLHGGIRFGLTEPEDDLGVLYGIIFKF